jgi:hypothetical protein
LSRTRWPSARHPPQCQGPRGQRLQAAQPRCSNDPTGASGNLGVSRPPPPPNFFVARFHYEYISISHSLSSSGTATATPAAGAAVGMTPGPATGGELRTPRGSLKTCWKSQRRSWRWRRSRCLRWCQRRSQQRGQLMETHEG